jgi:hypothetical protein
LEVPQAGEARRCELEVSLSPLSRLSLPLLTPPLSFGAKFIIDKSGAVVARNGDRLNFVAVLVIRVDRADLPVATIDRTAGIDLTKFVGVDGYRMFGPVEQVRAGGMPPVLRAAFSMRHVLEIQVPLAVFIDQAIGVVEPSFGGGKMKMVVHPGILAGRNHHQQGPSS